MNTHEQQVRELAYQIWESEGCPMGHSDRHWEMACKLAATYVDTGLSTSATGDTDTPSTEPVEPISPGTPQDQPVSDPIQPTEPNQQPAQPIAVAPPRKTRAKAMAQAPKSLIDNNPISMGRPADPEPEFAVKKTTRPRKSKTSEQAAENA